MLYYGEEWPSLELGELLDHPRINTLATIRTVP